MAQSIAPPPPGAPPRRTIQIDLDGEVVNFPWDAPTPPRKSDVMQWMQQRRTLDVPTSAPTREAPLPSQISSPTPSVRGVAPSIAPSPGAVEPPSSFLERVSKGASGLLDFGKTIGTLANPIAFATNYAQDPQGTIDRAKGLVEGMVVDPARELWQGATSPDPAGFTKGLARAGTKLYGADPTDIEQDWRQGNYGALAGDLVIPTALAGLTAGAARGIKGRAPVRPDVLPPLVDPNIPKRLTGKVARPDIEIPREPLQIEAPPERLQLPAVGETTVTGDPRFIQGRMGMVDASLDYPVDLVDPGKITNRDIVISPEGQYKPRLSTIMPEELGEVGSLNPIDVAAGNFSRRIAVRDPAQMHPAFGALVPERYSGMIDPNLTGTNIPLGLKGLDIEPPVLEHPLGGRVVEPPPVEPIGAPNPFETNFNVRTIPGEEASLFRPKTPKEQPLVYSPEARLEPTRTDFDAPNIQHQLRDVGRAAPIVNNMLDTARKSALPEMQDAAKKAEAAIRPSSTRRVTQDILQDGHVIIRKSGKAGVDLDNMIVRSRLDGEALGEQWGMRAEEAVAGLTPEQFETYVEARDTGQWPTDPAIVEALKARRRLDEEAISRTKASGMGLRTPDGIIPFQERTNHWPHIYPKEFFADKPAALEALMKDGMSPEDAANAIRNASRFGERIISPQNSRQTNAPGFRRDLNADKQHLADMAKRIVEAEQFGPMDLADANSPMSKLLKQTKDPERIREIVSKQLGRDLPESTTKDWGAVSKGVLKLETAMHLSQFAISNMSQLATTPLRGNMTAYAKALGKVVKDFKAAKGEAEGTGALSTIHQDILREVGGESRISKAFLMKQSETLNRTVAALTGKGTAEQLFATVKKGPQHTRARARLQNLLLEDIDQVIKQDKLTPEQLARAGGRMSEITQGRAQSIDLPPLWSKHPSTDMIFLYKKYAYRQSKIIADAIKENPKRNIPLAMALYATVGEVVGDAKAGIKGAFSGEGPIETIKARGDSELLQKVLDKPNAKIMGRVVANLGQAWALGLFADAIGSAGEGQYGMMKFLGGPVLGDATEAIAGGVSALPGYDKNKGFHQGNYKPLIKKGAKSIPYIGTGLAQRVPPNRPPKKNPFGLGAVSTPKFGLPQR